MASTETPAPEPEKVVEAAHEQENVVETSVVEQEKVAEAPPPEVEEATAPPPEVKTPGGAPPIDYFSLAEVVLRFLLFASAVVAVVVMVTSKQTKNSLPAKFNHLPAFIYFVAALSVAGLYSIITTLLSFYALLKPGCCPKVLSYFIIFDVLLLGIVAAATGSAGAVAYTGVKGNSHLGWRKVSDVYDEFCRHVGASIFFGLFASIVLVSLVLLSIYSISKKIPK